MKSKLGIPFGIIMRAGQHPASQCVPQRRVTWDTPRGKCWSRRQSEVQGRDWHFLLTLLDPADVERGLDSTACCPLISICLLTRLLLLTAKNISHRLPGRKVKEASFFSCIFQLGVCRKELITIIYLYFCRKEENNGSLLNSH